MRESQYYVNAYLKKLSFLTASFSRVRKVTNTFVTCKDKGKNNSKNILIVIKFNIKEKQAKKATQNTNAEIYSSLPTKMRDFGTRHDKNKFDTPLNKPSKKEKILEKLFKAEYPMAYVL